MMEAMTFSLVFLVVHSFGAVPLVVIFSVGLLLS